MFAAGAALRLQQFEDPTFYDQPAATAVGTRLVGGAPRSKQPLKGRR
jgi:hypothetical protein